MPAEAIFITCVAGLFLVAIIVDGRRRWRYHQQWRRDQATAIRLKRLAAMQLSFDEIARDFDVHPPHDPEVEQGMLDGWYEARDRATNADLKRIYG